MKIAVDSIGIYPGERGLTGSRRSPQDERENVPVLDREPQRFSLAHEMFLPDKLVKTARPDPVCQRFHKGMVSNLTQSADAEHRAQLALQAGRSACSIDIQQMYFLSSINLQSF